MDLQEAREYLANRAGWFEVMAVRSDHGWEIVLRLDGTYGLDPDELDAMVTHHADRFRTSVLDALDVRPEELRRECPVYDQSDRERRELARGRSQDERRGLA